MVGSLVHLVSLLDHDWYAAGGGRLPDTPQGTADPLTKGYPHTYYILVLPAFFCRRVKLTKIRENCTERSVTTKSIRDRPLEP